MSLHFFSLKYLSNNYLRKSNKMKRSRFPSCVLCFLIFSSYPWTPTANQLVSDDIHSFTQYWNATQPFESSDSPQTIGIEKLPGDRIWYLKSYRHTDSNSAFQMTLNIPDWICRPTEILVSIRYFSTLAPFSLWPIIDTDNDDTGNYFHFEDSKDGWNTIVKPVDLDRSEEIRIEGAVFPMGHIVFDEIIVLYVEGDGNCAEVTMTTPSPGTNSTTSSSHYTSRTTHQTTAEEYSTDSSDFPTSDSSDVTSDFFTPSQYDTETATDTYATTPFESVPTTNLVSDATTITDMSDPPTPSSTDQPTTTHETVTTEGSPITEEVLTTPSPSTCDIPFTNSTTVHPDIALGNFMKWKIPCFFDWVNLKGVMKDDVTAPDRGPFAMRGELYNLNTTIKNIVGFGVPSYFTNSSNRDYNTSTYGDMNSGWMYTTFYRIELNVTGTFESIGAVLDFMPFNATGTLSWTGSGTYTFHGRFTIENGYIKLNNGSESRLDEFRQSRNNVTGFHDESIPESLMNECRGLATSEIISQIDSVFLGYYPRFDDSIHALSMEYWSNVFAATPVLDILRTPNPMG